MEKINFKLAIPYALLILLICVGAFYFNKVNKLETSLQSETNLRLALVDTVSVYKNQRDELVAEKRTMQFKLNEKEFENNELIKRVKETEKKNATLEKKVTVIAAALIESQVVIDSLQKSNVYVSDKDSSVIFTSKNPTLIEYTFKVKPVFTIKNQPPELTFEYFKIPNKQFIEFHWRNNKKEGYPIAFSVSNSSKYFETVNIDSYVIPEIYKPDVDPTFWQKVGKTAKKSSNILIGIGIGAGAVLILK